MNKLKTRSGFIFITAIGALTLSGCSSDWFKKLSYETANNYVCEEQEPNLPDRVRQCRESKMSYEEYQEARARTLSDD